MTTKEIRDYARSYSRGSSSGFSDTHVNSLIDIGQRTFAKEVGGLPSAAYLAVKESFDLDPTMGIRIMISGSANNDTSGVDVAVTDAALSDQTGSAVATKLQAQLRSAIGTGADITASWADYAFTIDAVTPGSSIEISSPTSIAYSDATDRLFGGTPSGTRTAVGSFPEGCTAYADLPSDFSVLERVYWDKCSLREVPKTAITYPQASGTPAYFSIRGKKIFIYPVPTRQEEFYLEYKAVPTLGTFDTDMSSLIPEESQIAVAYWVAAEILKQSFEEDISKARATDYMRVKSRYVVAYQNRSTETVPRDGIERPYRVIV